MEYNTFTTQKYFSAMQFPCETSSMMDPLPSSQDCWAPTPLTKQEGRDGILDILESVEGILDSDPMYDEISDNVDRILNADENEMLLAAPTPIGPRGVQQVVSKVEITDNSWLQDEGLVGSLRHVLQQAGEPKRERMFEVFSPRKRPRFSAKMDMKQMPTKQVSTDFDEDTTSVSGSDNGLSQRFRGYQSEQWHERFQELIQFRATYGHCLVPYKWSENVGLAQWVKRQRYQYKLKKSGMHATMTDDREAMLEQLGFVWDSHAAVWEERFMELRNFRDQQGHCVVPNTYPENPTLATWVKCQRRQYKLFLAGKKSNITQERIAQLNSLDFEWNPRNLKLAVNDESFLLIH